MEGEAKGQQRLLKPIGCNNDYSATLLPLHCMETGRKEPIGRIPQCPSVITSWCGLSGVLAFLIGPLQFFLQSEQLMDPHFKWKLNSPSVLGLAVFFCLLFAFSEATWCGTVAPLLAQALLSPSLFSPFYRRSCFCYWSQLWVPVSMTGCSGSCMGVCSRCFPVNRRGSPFPSVYRQ